MAVLPLHNTSNPAVHEHPERNTCGHMRSHDGFRPEAPTGIRKHGAHRLCSCLPSLLVNQVVCTNLPANTPHLLPMRFFMDQQTTSHHLAACPSAHSAPPSELLTLRCVISLAGRGPAQCWLTADPRRSRAASQWA